MKIIIITSFFLILLSSAESKIAPVFNLENSSYVGFPNTLNGKDFFTLQTNSFSSAKSQYLNTHSNSCRNQIKTAMCLVEPMKEGEDFKTRKCQDGSLSYASYFESLYDNYPPAMQKIFCSLHRIFIEKQFFGTAYASSIYDTQGKHNGALIGIRKSVLDESLNLTTWSSWKEQLSFGGVTDSYSVTSDLPQVITSSHSITNDFLYFVVIHEFGHLFDFANDLNKQVNCPEPSDEDEEPECAMAESSFGAISWETDRMPKDENEFLNRNNLCFYSCNGKTLKKNDVPLIYESLLNTDFISTYGATQPWDDFAESLAYFTIDEKLKVKYVLDTKQGQYYDSILKLKSPIFEMKLKYIQEFFNRPDILYP